MSRRGRRWLLALAIIVIVVGVGGFVVSKLFGGDNNGSVRVGTASELSGDTPTVPPLAIKNDLFATSLPNSFNLKRQTIPTASSPRLQLLAATNSTIDEQFAATVDILPSEGLAGVGDYNLRLTQPQTYARYTPPSLPAGAVAFRTVSGPAAFTVFWPHGNRYAELAFSTDTTATLQQLIDVYIQALSAWSWQ